MTAPDAVRGDAPKTHRNRTVIARPGPRLLAIATALYAAFVVYGSLVPLAFEPRPLLGAWLAFQHVPYYQLGVESRADWVANIVLYVPLSFLAASAVVSRARSPLYKAIGISVVAMACIVLAFAVEFAQLFFPPRTVSQNDLIAETVGTLLGVAVWIAAGPRLLATAHRLSWGGVHTWQAFAALYTIAYLSYSLFPFDFLVSAAELRSKLTQSSNAAWLLAGSCGNVLGCTVKLGAEIVLAVPLGALAGLAFSSLRIRAAFTIGLTLGLAIESTQIFLASGTSQGFSVLARGLGMAWGLALQHQFRLQWLTRHPQLRQRAVLAAIPLCLALLVGLNGFAGKLEPLWVARHKLAETRFLPFYYHYFTTETAALASLLANAGAYAFVGLGLWLWNPLHRLGLRSGVIALVIALGIESLKLFLPGKHADPTNLLIAFSFAACMNVALCRLTAATHPSTTSPTQARQRAPHRVQRWWLAAALTVMVILGAAMLVASPNPEQPVNEATLPQLPPPHELPAVSLPSFRAEHPRLPHPSAQDLATLVTSSPDFIRDLRARARSGQGNIEASALLELLEPGSVDLAVLHRRLMALRFDWRGHEQGRPLAVAYDWLYPRWSESQRRQLQGKLAEGAEYIIKVIREERLSPYNVILYNSPFQALVACTLALYGDDPRGEPAMRFTHDLWKTRVLPVWRQIMGKNGGWHEGAEYVGIGVGQAIYQVPAMWRSATGEDLFASEPGIHGFLDFLIYRARPDGTHFRWGDGAFFDNAVPDRTALAMEFGHAATLSVQPPRKEPVPTGWPWGPLTGTGPIDSAAINRLPLTRHFDGIGMLVARSDWTPDATYVTFKAGDNYWSHVHLDQGAFTIYKGGELAIDSGLYGPSYGSDHHLNYSYQTIAHNTITVTDPDDRMPMPANQGEQRRAIANDGGQRRIGSGWGVEAAPLDLDEWQSKREIYHTARIDKIIERDGIVAAVADLTAAYTNGQSGQGTFSHRTRRVDRLWRTFGYDRIDDVVVVFDQVSSTRAAHRKRWLLHTIEAPRVVGNRFTVGISPLPRPGHGGGRLEGQVLLPKDALINAIGGPGFEFFVDDQNYDEKGKLQETIKKLGPGRAEPGAWRLEVSPGRDAKSDLFLIVMLPATLTGQVTHRVRLLEEGGKVGCEVVGPKRTTRWWFGARNNELEVEIGNWPIG